VNLRNRFLLGVFAVQAIVLVALFWPEPPPPTPEQLFAGLERDQIVQVTLSDSTGRRVQLARGPEGCTFPDADGYPCKLDKMLSFLDKIVALKSEKLVSQTAASHRRLSVADDEFGRLIELELTDGTSRKLFLGTSPRLRSVHVRAVGQSAVYLATTISTTDAAVRAISWTESRYLSVPRDDVVAITLNNAQGRFEFERDGAGEWDMEGLAAGETVDQAVLNGILSRVSALSMRRPLGLTELDSYGLQDPGAVLTVETRDAEGNTRTYELLVGAEMGDEDFAVKSSESEYHVLIPGYSVKDFVEKTRENLVDPPPTPTPSATSTSETP